MQSNLNQVQKSVVTPAMLALQPVRLQAMGGEYCFTNQQRKPIPGLDPIMYTGGGTQTFAHNGRPSDSDND